MYSTCFKSSIIWYLSSTYAIHCLTFAELPTSDWEEDHLETEVSDSKASLSSVMNQELAALVQRLESVAVRLEGVHGTSDQKVIVSGKLNCIMCA